MRRIFINNKESDYLSIRALEDTSIQVQTIDNVQVFAQINNGDWEEVNNNTVELSSGDIIKYKSSIDVSANNTAAGKSMTFSISNKVELFGDSTSMLKNRELFNCAFSYSFEKLPIVSVSPNFLPSTKLANGCYQYMFSGCTSLTTAPELPATKLENFCYYSMFRGCTKLNYIKMLAIDISATNCLSGWVNGVASTGTFVKNYAMTTLPTGTSGIPSGWTVFNDDDGHQGGLGN